MKILLLTLIPNDLVPSVMTALSLEEVGKKVQQGQTTVESFELCTVYTIEESPVTPADVIIVDHQVDLTSIQSVISCIRGQVSSIQVVELCSNSPSEASSEADFVVVRGTVNWGDVLRLAKGAAGLSEVCISE